MLLNRSRCGWWALVAILASAAWTQEGAVAPTLKVGDPAPQLFVSKWLNGEAVERFEKDKIYVLECWATWCGPCRASIPHVSEMNTKFKDQNVVIIGMNVWEKDTDLVEPFVKEMGEKMNYRVAMDEPHGKTAEAWLTASGQDGIPCAFVVDKEGKIAWIGHPMNGMDRVIEQLIAGTFDAQKTAELAAKLEDLKRRFQAAAQAGDVDRLLALTDEIPTVDPNAVTQARVMKFQILLLQKKDYEAAYALAVQLAEGELKNVPPALNEMAWNILDGEGIEKRDLDLALKMATSADEQTKHEDPSILDTLARAYFEKGQLDKAIEAQALAVEKAPEGDIKNDLQATLNKYKEKKE